LKELYAGTTSLKKGHHQDFAIISMRRMGKSSLLEVLCQKLKDEQIAAMRMDCSKLFPSDLLTFLDTYHALIWETYARVANWKSLTKAKILNAIYRFPDAMDWFLRRIEEMGVDVESERIWFKLRRNPENLSRLFNTTFDLPEELADRTKIPAVVMLDEFQELVQFGRKFIFALRAKFTEQKNSAYIVSGSAPGMLSKTILTKKAPFYGAFIVRRLDPFDFKTSQEFVRTRFATVGIDISNAATDMIAENSDGIPFYLQWIGYETHIMALYEKSKKVDVDIVEKAITTRLRYIPQLEYDFAGFTPRQKQILLRMASSDLNHPAKIAKALRYKHVHHITRELRALEDQGYLIRKDRGEYHIYSKIFRNWLTAKADDLGYSEPPSMKLLFSEDWSD